MNHEPTTVFIVTDDDGMPVVAMGDRMSAELLAFVVGGKVIEAIAVVVEIDGAEHIDMDTAVAAEHVCDDCRARERQEQLVAEYSFEHRN
jgi:hypothetical protein